MKGKESKTLLTPSRKLMRKAEALCIRSIFMEKFGRTIPMNLKSYKRHFPEYIKYKGSVNYDESVETLKNYFALVFPTLFYTEEYLGTIIDAYAAGLPVISSKWESYDDVIEDNITGIGYKFGSDDALVEVLENVQKEKPARR